MDQDRNHITKGGYNEIPSDLPINQPQHPGKPLTHRFQPESSQRQIIESPDQHKKLASEVNFDPVATINLPEKNVYVKPVKNFKPRQITPIPLKGSVILPIRGEKVFNFGEDFQRQMQKRVGAIMNQYEFNPKEGNLGAKKIEPSSTTTINRVPPPLGGVQKDLQQTVVTPPIQNPTIIQPPSPMAPFVQKAQPPLQPPPTQPIPQSPEPLKQEPGAFVEDINKIKARLNQEVIQKDVSQERVVELTQRYQSQIKTLKEEKNFANIQVESLKKKLLGETKKKEAIENQMNAREKELQIQMNRLKIDRDGILGKVRETETKLKLLEGVSEKFKVDQVEITQLKAKLALVETEKETMEQKAMRLETTLDEIVRKPPTQSDRIREVIVPQPLSEKPSNAPVKIVAPKPAIGRMAPSLTTLPNVVTGMVKDINGLLLIDVIIVVKDQSGNSVRALKSNKIGRFAISTPLPNGTYTMELEKDDQQFDIVQIKLEGKIIPPIEIKAI